MLTLSHLCTGYKKNKSLKQVTSNLNLTIETGNLVGILGGNGIGKSTLLKTIAGFETPLSGRVLLYEQPIHTMNKHKKAKNISIVLTERKITTDLTGKEVIALGRQPYTNWIGSQTDKDKEIIANIINWLNLEKLVEKTLKTMSDGEIQKVLLARTLTQDTSLILLDEPDSHLDLHSKAILFQQIKQIVKQSSKTILFTSHDLNTAIQVCNRLILLLENNMWEYGTPKELIEKGVFQKIFPKETVHFNLTEKQFKISF